MADSCGYDPFLWFLRLGCFEHHLGDEPITVEEGSEEVAFLETLSDFILPPGTDTPGQGLLRQDEPLTAAVVR